MITSIVLTYHIYIHIYCRDRFSDLVYHHRTSATKLTKRRNFCSCQVRQKAAESLASLCKGDRLAKALAENLTPMLCGNLAKFCLRYIWYMCLIFVCNYKSFIVFFVWTLNFRHVLLVMCLDSFGLVCFLGWEGKEDKPASDWKGWGVQDIP